MANKSFKGLSRAEKSRPAEEVTMSVLAAVMPVTKGNNHIVREGWREQRTGDKCNSKIHLFVGSCKI